MTQWIGNTLNREQKLDLSSIVGDFAERKARNINF